MRAHWEVCLGIKTDEILLPMVVPAKPPKGLNLGGRSGTAVHSGPVLGELPGR